MLVQSVFCFSQQRSVCEIVPLHIGKYPITLSKYENGVLGDMVKLHSEENYIIVGGSEIKIVMNKDVKHNFKYTSIPRSGIEYLMYDQKYETDVNVYITYIKTEDMNKYFGLFVKYKDDLEYVFTYKAGTQIE